MTLVKSLRIALVAAIAAIPTLASAGKKNGLERLGDFLIDRATNRVATVFNSRAESFGFSAVRAWFNGQQNGHPAYYASEIKPGIIADRNGILAQLAGSAARMPKVGTIITLRGGTYADEQVRIPEVKLRRQKFIVMQIDGRPEGQRILIPFRSPTGRTAAPRAMRPSGNKTTR
jgi:hypothetical protein